MKMTIKKLVMICVFCLSSVLLWNPVNSIAAETEDADYETLNTSACVRNQTQHNILKMNCKPGQMIRIMRIFLGYSSTSKCEYTNGGGAGGGDCIMDLPNSDNYSCVGTDACLIRPFSSSNIGKVIPTCKRPITYMQAQYQCIPESSSVSVCQGSTNSVLTQQRGYLRTPNYPRNYPNNKNCTFTLTAPYEGQRLRLILIDFNLEPQGTACSDWMQVFDGFQSITLCGQRTRYWLRNSTQRSIRIQFNSDGRNSDKGFWLYYEAFPFMKKVQPLIEATTTSSSSSSSSSSSPSPSTTTRIRPWIAPPYKTILLPPTEAVSSQYSSSSSSSSTSSLSDASPTVSDQIVYMASDGSSLPLGVLTAGVITLLISILIILLIIVLIKSRSRRNSLTSEGRIPEDSDRIDNMEREKRTFFPSPRSSFREPSSATTTTAAPGQKSLITDSQGDTLLSPSTVEAYLSSSRDGIRDAYCERRPNTGIDLI